MRGAGLSVEVGELDGVEGSTTVAVLHGVEGSTIVAVLDGVEGSTTMTVLDGVEGMMTYVTGSTRTKSTMKHKKWFHTIYIKHVQTRSNRPWKIYDFLP
jgi:hypothetical protein